MLSKSVTRLVNSNSLAENSRTSTCTKDDSMQPLVDVS